MGCKKKKKHACCSFLANEARPKKVMLWCTSASQVTGCWISLEINKARRGTKLSDCFADASSSQINSAAVFQNQRVVIVLAIMWPFVRKNNSVNTASLLLKLWRLSHVMWFQLRLVDTLDSFLTNEETLWQLSACVTLTGNPGVQWPRPLCACSPSDVVFGLNSNQDDWLVILTACAHTAAHCGFINRCQEQSELSLYSEPSLEFCFLGNSLTWHGVMNLKCRALAHLFSDVGTWTRRQRRPSPGRWSVRLGWRHSCRCEGREDRLWKRQEWTRCLNCTNTHRPSGNSVVAAAALCSRVWSIKLTKEQRETSW